MKCREGLPLGWGEEEIITLYPCSSGGESKDQSGTKR
jgi:hypothetical protein